MNNEFVVYAPNPECDFTGRFRGSDRLLALV